MAIARVAAIVAMDEGRVIGRDGALPWHLPEDLAYFKEHTAGHIVIMGRKTWDSLPARFRPLPGRLNIVVSRKPDALELPQGVLAAGSVEEALRIAEERSSSEQIAWIIGGAELYAAGLPFCKEVHLTLVHGHHQGDARLPRFEESFVESSAQRGDRCTFKVYRRSR